MFNHDKEINDSSSFMSHKIKISGNADICFKIQLNVIKYIKQKKEIHLKEKKTKITSNTKTSENVFRHLMENGKVEW